MTSPYAGPFEMLTVEEAAARMRCGTDLFMSVYDGPRHYLSDGEGKLRFPAWALHEWSVARAIQPGAKSGGSAWDGVGDATGEGKKSVSKRQQGAPK